MLVRLEAISLIIARLQDPRRGDSVVLVGVPSIGRNELLSNSQASDFKDERDVGESGQQSWDIILLHHGGIKAGCRQEYYSSVSAKQTHNARSASLATAPVSNLWYKVAKVVGEGCCMLFIALMLPRQKKKTPPRNVYQRGKIGELALRA